MKLSESQRSVAFLKSKSLNPVLGDLFQNEMILTSVDISAELKRLDEVETSFKQQIQGYREYLTDILVEIEQEKDILS